MMEDFFAVNEGGDFSYYRSEEELLRDFEYVNEASSIVDRAGHTYGLEIGPDRALRLGRSLGTVEGRWLRQTWNAAVHRNVREHPLQRFQVGGDARIVREVFEILSLERAEEASWVLKVGAQVSHPKSIEEMSRMLGRRGSLDEATAYDPYGHCYRPRRHRGRPSLPFVRRSICYIEIPCAPGARHAPAREGDPVRRRSRP